MRRFLFSLLFVFCAGFDAAFADSFKSFDGRFSIDFPSNPSLKIVKSVGSCMKEVYEFRVKETWRRSWMVSYRDCQPSGALADVGINPTLLDLTKNTAKAVLGELRASDPIQHGRLSGREALILVPATVPAAAVVYRARFFIEGDRIYTVMYEGPFGTEADPEVEAFFASFKIMR